MNFLAKGHNLDSKKGGIKLSKFGIQDKLKLSGNARLTKEMSKKLSSGRPTPDMTPLNKNNKNGEGLISFS